ncbi:hypothetical protein SKAU_G00284460 [Synaphobranchus kaupii]|uniref:R3H domain-containing protein n=1 Tax=Synaphobranchus kaupii TaxID=118154 RepID=A0A9Q1EXT3_SYNKA|nr:hypothetical protein SKAU_G00284460 [Synaphobranchus kaupii]
MWQYVWSTRIFASFELSGQTAACSATLAFSCVDGCYLPKQENDFVDTVIEELEAFVQRDQQKSILLFPPLPSRLRYLTHKTAENYPSLSTFSVGRVGWSRRVVVCFSQLRLSPEDGSDTEGRVCERSRVRGRGMESSKGGRMSETRQTRSRSHRHPDKAIYVPRAMRERVGQGSPTLPTVATPTPQTPPTIDSTGCSLSLSASEESCPDTPEGPAPTANQDPASDCTEELLGDPEDLPGPADSGHCSWEQTMSYFVAMSLDDQLDDGSGSFSSTHPEVQLQMEDAKDFGDYVQEISGQLKEADFTIESVHSDYSGYENLWIGPGEFSHVVEIYNFPAIFKTEDLLDAFAEFSEGGLKIKWVDNTHALGVFSSESAALQALSIQHPLLKVRSLYEGSKKSKGKALRRAEFIQPVKERPRTDTAVARRMVTRALGLPKPVPRGKRC